MGQIRKPADPRLGRHAREGRRRSREAAASSRGRRSRPGRCGNQARHRQARNALETVAIVFTITVLGIVAVAGFATAPRFPPDVVSGPGVGARGNRGRATGARAGLRVHLQLRALGTRDPRHGSVRLRRPSPLPHGLAGPRVGSALCFASGPAMVFLLCPPLVLSTARAWLVWNLTGAVAAGWAVGVLPGDEASLRRSTHGSR
jgi:hypothetical protein